jgi:hypothetical protein
VLLARAPGRYRFLEMVNVDRECGGKLELFSDEPLLIELVNVRKEPVEAAIVEHAGFRGCGSGTNWNDAWRATSDRAGRVFFPHYASWVAGSDFNLRDWLELQTPVKDPLRFGLRITGSWTRPAHVDEDPRVVRWQLPPLSKIRVEFAGADAVPADHAITFEMVGPNQYFGVPDRYASDHGQPVELVIDMGKMHIFDRETEKALV